MRPSRFLAGGWLLSGSLLVFASGCGSGVITPSEPTVLEVVAGNHQTAEVGAALPVTVVLKASNARGPMANITITVTPGSGSGSISPSSLTTGTDGTAQFSWTLGTRAGTQSLSAKAGATRPVTANLTATANPGPVDQIAAASEAVQPVVVGHAVPVRPVVRVTDRYQNPISGVAINFQPDLGASVLTGTSQLTDAEGKATLGSWTIGTDAGSYTVRGYLLNGNSAVFEARGIPATLLLLEGNGQSANAGTAVPLAPAVRAARDDGSPLPNVSVDFIATGGGGQVQGAPAITGADGIARPIRWILGPSAGNNRLQATTLGRPPVVFDATGLAGIATSFVMSSGNGLAGYFGNFLPGVPEVSATDASGNPVANIPVAFQAASGSGAITGAVTQTDYLGRARPTSWRLGASGTQTVTATSAGFAPVSFTAQASSAPPSTFRIEVRYADGTNPTPTQRAAFDAAIARWTTLVVAGGPPYLINENAGCGNMVGQTIDGVVITVVLRQLSGNILGSSGPCILRDQGYLPVQGYMEFNTNFLGQLEQNGQLGSVVLHEMAHALGFGTIWNYNGLPGNSSNHLLDGSPGSDPTFNGSAARVAFFGSMSLGFSFPGTPVPVEGLPAGPGTAYSHWRKTTFTNELMTGFLGAPPNPLSAISVASLRDLGYQVNDAIADPFSFMAQLQGYGPPALRIVEGRLPGDILVINRQGRRVRSIPRK
jgi:hypothetical protein